MGGGERTSYSRYHKGRRLVANALLRSLASSLRQVERTGQRVHGAEIRPGPAAQRDDALADYIRASSVTCFHPVGTCRMGPAADDVVDAQLRVRASTACASWTPRSCRA